MILNNTPANEAILSNVGSVNSFSIKATAKSFAILSSGLYANKIRAIIRELSCNALDSHVAAGKIDIPFVVHLPNSMEPYFSVRDFGTGLSHDQVVGIFTTFFESTKTGSNDFIGALGLGSKSPFSYTDNFTVTAVQAGRKGVYTAFINEEGVPSIALMMSEDTDEPAGVEVKFAVTERYDFSKFREEAQVVFKFWKNRPTMTGDSGFKFLNAVYKDQNIVPGVHSIDDPYRTTSTAIMGNIAYRIEVPAADTTISPHLRQLLNCGLVMEFNIGELDFQASREGLSYIPLTINSIKAKLEALAAQLTVHLAAEADKIENLWERSAYLFKRMDDNLWAAAVSKYVADTKFPLLSVTGNRWNSIKRFDLNVQDLATKFNIVIRGFTKSRGVNSCSSLKADTVWDRSSGQAIAKTEWQIRVEMDRYFVFNDSKVGALERAKYHWRQSKPAATNYSDVVYVLEAADKTKPMKRAEFLAEIMNPPAANIMDVSSLMSKERTSGMGKNVTILQLSKRSRGYRYAETFVWEDAGKADTFDANTTYYYLPLSGYKSLGKVEDIKWLHETLKNSGIYAGKIFGVRKGDSEWVATQKNWINLDTMVESKLKALSNADVMGIVKEAIGFDRQFHWKVSDRISPTSPYATFTSQFAKVKAADSTVQSGLQALCREYKVVTATVDPSAMIDQYKLEIESLNKRYPLLSAISRYSVEDSVIGDYINLVDNANPV